MNKYAVWFKRVVWLGILADWLLGIPAIFAPEWFFGLLGLRQTADPVWTGVAALLVVLLSFFYIPGANHPHRFRPNAWLAVLARAPGAIFFLLLYPDLYPAFGILDAVLFLLGLPLLLLTLRQPSDEEPRETTDALQAPTDERPAVWLKRTIWVRIVLNWVLAVPLMFAPEQVLDILGLRQTQDPVWTAFTGLIAFLHSVIYIWGANFPYRYRYNAWASVLPQVPVSAYFLLLHPGLYTLVGSIDLGLFLLQFPFLVKAMQLVPARGRQLDKDIHPYRGNTYRYVKEATWQGPYDGLPYHKGLGTPASFIQLFNDASRNLHDRRDIRQYYDKLVHSNGIAFAGFWRIENDSPYTGYFSKGSEGLLVARASVAGLTVSRGTRRAFAIAGKVFPTLDPDEWVWPGNFVTVSHLGGFRTRYITDIEITNFAPVGLNPITNIINRVIFRLTDTRPGYRQLFPISTLGLKRGDPVVTPDLLMLKLREDMPKIDAKDFREELRLKHYPDHKLFFTINVKNFGEEEWNRLGVLEFTEDVVSEGSDKHLHFWIPRDVPNLPKQV